MFFFMYIKRIYKRKQVDNVAPEKTLSKNQQVNKCFLKNETHRMANQKLLVKQNCQLSNYFFFSQINRFRSRKLI